MKLEQSISVIAMQRGMQEKCRLNHNQRTISELRSGIWAETKEVWLDSVIGM